VAPTTQPLQQALGRVAVAETRRLFHVARGPSWLKLVRTSAALGECGERRGEAALTAGGGQDPALAS
jgi:hypothetical protein